MQVLNSTKATEIKSSLSKGYTDEGIARFKQGDIIEAINFLTLATEFNPLNADAYYYRALAYLAIGEPLNFIPDCNTSLLIRLDEIRAICLEIKSELRGASKEEPPPCQEGDTCSIKLDHV